MTRAMLAATLAWILFGTVPVRASGEDIRIGVRADAPPFSYRMPDGKDETCRDDPSAESNGLPDDRSLSGPLIRCRYTGYVVYICDRIVLEMRKEIPGLIVEAVPVTADDRFQKLMDDELDILCDPATATQDRTENLMASLPIYLSGVSFASHSANATAARLDARRRAAEEANAAEKDPYYDLDCMHLVGLVSNTTAETKGLAAIRASGEWGSDASSVQSYLEGWNKDEEFRDAEACQEDAAHGRNRKDQPKVNPVRIFATHDEVADAFCKFRVKYYVGDIEIINRALASRCSYQDAAITYTDERYTIFTRVPGGDARGPLIGKFLKTLSSRVYATDSILIEAYRETLHGYHPTKKLQLLMWSLSGSVPD